MVKWPHIANAAFRIFLKIMVNVVTVVGFRGSIAAIAPLWIRPCQTHVKIHATSTVTSTHSSDRHWHVCWLESVSKVSLHNNLASPYLCRNRSKISDKSPLLPYWRQFDICDASSSEPPLKELLCLALALPLIKLLVLCLWIGRTQSRRKGPSTRRQGGCWKRTPKSDWGPLLHQNWTH